MSNDERDAVSRMMIEAFGMIVLDMLAERKAHARRVQELLEANAALEERARAAEAALSAREKKTVLVIDVAAFDSIGSAMTWFDYFQIEGWTWERADFEGVNAVLYGVTPPTLQSELALPPFASWSER